jgi:hypothetical protein
MTLIPTSHLDIYVKAKESRNRLGVAQRVPGGLGSQIPWNLAHEDGEVVSLTHRPALPPEMFLVFIFSRGWMDSRVMVRSKTHPHTHTHTHIYIYIYRL